MRSKVLLFLLMVITFSCNTNLLDNNKSRIAQAERLLESNPDSVIVLSDNWLKDTTSGNISDKTLIDIFLLKERAFSKQFQVDSVLYYATLIRELARPINDSLAIAESLLYIVGDMDESEKAKIEKLLPAAIRQMEKAGRPLDVAKLEGKYGIILTTRGEYSQSQPHLIKAYEILKQQDRKRELISICLGLGGNFSAIGSPKETLNYYLEAYQLANELKDADRLPMVLINLGFYYAQMKNRDSSMYYYNLAKSTAPANAQFIIRTKIDYNINLDLLKSGEYREAERGLKAVLDSVEGKGMLEVEAMIQKALSETYQSEGQYAAAIQALNRTVVLADSINDNAIKLEAYQLLTDIYAKKGDYAQAFSNQLLFQQMKDSMLSKDKQLAIHDLEEKYQSEKKELENKALRSTLSFRNSGILGLVLLISALVIFVVILRQRNRYHLERTRSYEVLMDRYRAELKKQEELSGRKSTEIEQIAGAISMKGSTISNDRSVSDIGKGSSSLSSIKKKDVVDEEVVQEHELISKLKMIMQTEKPYLNTKLKVDEVASKMNVAERKLSQLLKEYEGVSFNYFVNQYRVEEARRLMDQPDSFHLKLEVIAQNAGFGSRQSFYNYFEQVTGVNPGYYREAIRSNNKQEFPDSEEV